MSTYAVFIQYHRGPVAMTYYTWMRDSLQSKGICLNFQFIIVVLTPRGNISHKDTY